MKRDMIPSGTSGFYGKWKRPKPEIVEAEFFEDDSCIDRIWSARRDKHLPSVGADLAALDTLLDRHGLAKILRGLRELCDSRCATDEESFDVAEECDAWKTRADYLETLNAKGVP
jgi:hypothetical protein